MFKIYCIKNLDNGRCYVGQTIQKNIAYRLASHRCDKRDKPLSNDLRSKEFSFSIYLLATCSEQGEADLLETKFIKDLNAAFPVGYNIRSMGGHKAPTEESTKEKIRATKLGRIVSEETRLLISKSKTGILVGELSANAKLTWKIVAEIRSLLKEGNLRQIDIAKLFNIKQTAVSCIKLGKTWKES